MMASALVVTDRRSARVAVARSALSAAAENGAAACAMASEAIEQAISAAVNGHVDLHLHRLQRAAFELQELRPSLAALAGIAEASPAT